MSKAPIQKFADVVSSIFVPMVVAASAIVWLGWYLAGIGGAYPATWLPEGTSPFLFALLFGIAVLVIACPCALGLATPTAVMVATGVGAQHGILIKGGDALESAHKVRGRESARTVTFVSKFIRIQIWSVYFFVFHRLSSD